MSAHVLLLRPRIAFGALRVSTFSANPSTLPLALHLLIFFRLRCMVSVSYLVATELARISLFIDLCTIPIDLQDSSISLTTTG